MEKKSKKFSSEFKTHIVTKLLQGHTIISKLASSKPLMILDHSLGGGANEYTNILVTDKPLAIIIRYDLADKYFFTEFYGQKIEKLSFKMESLKEIEQIIKYFNVEEVIINELVSYPKVLDVLDFLVELKKMHNNINFIFMVHDFFCVCPMYNLLDYEIKYCNLPLDTSYCDKCIKLNPLIKANVPFVQQDYPNLTIDLWREKFGNLLKCSFKIMCFSQSSKELIQKAYPSLSDSKFEVKPHVVNWVRPVVISKTSETINVAVLGHLTVHKGASIICDIADYIYRSGYNITIHHFGSEYIHDNNISKSFNLNPIIAKHGQYKKEDLSELMEKYEIDCILIPSIWPETFSYTTEEAIKMDLPVAVFDLGAPSERVKNYPKGIILENKNPAYIINKILELIGVNNLKLIQMLPKISIIVPTYNTPKQFLTDVLESVLSQTYSNWELCIADGASTKKHVKKILDNYVKKDNRIKVKYLSENKGIAGNSNEALSLATGDYVALLDHDDLLAPFALFEVVKAINENPDSDFIYSDEDKISEDGTKRLDPHFKPDFAPDTLRSYNYICHLSVIKKSLLDEIGWFKEGFDGSQDYELILRATEKAKKIVHIPKILYHWRMSQNSTSQSQGSKPYAFEAAKRALKNHLDRIGLKGQVRDGLFSGSYKIGYAIDYDYKVSIIIPNKDHKEDLERCINSILAKSTYKNYEIIIAENNSTEEETFKYYENLKNNHYNIFVLEWKNAFNYSAVNNFAAKHAKGEILLFLNNDTEVINENWLEEMIQYAQRKDVGAVGAKLYYPDDTIQHGGVILGIGAVADHAFRYMNKDSDGYFGRLKIVQNLSAVTGACLMMRKEVFSEVKGFDENYPIAYNDIDLCLKVRDKGYLVVWTPYAELYHYEFQTRGLDDNLEKQERVKKEIELFKRKWGKYLEKGDPYYNPNFTLIKTDFSTNYHYYNDYGNYEDEKYSLEGIYYLRIGNIEESKKCFKKALQLNPKNMDALFCMGSFCLKENKLEEAMNYFNSILENNLLKDNKIQLSCLCNNLGILKIKLGDHEKGVELIKKAFEMNPNYRDAQHNVQQINNQTFDFKITRKLMM